MPSRLAYPEPTQPRITTRKQPQPREPRRDLKRGSVRIALTKGIFLRSNTITIIRRVIM